MLSINRETRDIMIPVLLLVGIGMLMVFSSTAVMSSDEHETHFHYVLSQLFAVAVGFVAFAFAASIDYRKLRRPVVYVLMGFSLLLLGLVFTPGIGVTVNGASRWLNAGVMTFQPSELTKVVIVFFLADYMDSNIQRMREFRRGLIVPLLVVAGFQGIILLQPDFGAVMSLGLLAIALLILGGARIAHVGAIIGSALPVVYFLITSEPYRIKRVLCFLDPWKERFDCGYQLVQSFIAFGKGSIFGVGLGDSRQKLFFLPEVHTDFIFSLIGEETGLIGVFFVLALFLWLFLKGIKIARAVPDPFSYFLAMGLSMMIGIQTVINMAVTTGLMPTKGLPLPFISFGGSALLINMIAVGILVNIANRNGMNTSVRGKARGDMTLFGPHLRRGV